MAIRLRYGIDKDTNVLTYIKDALPSPSRQYLCPCCGQPLIVKKIDRYRRPHYAHLGVPCAGGPESAFHILCKDIIERNKGNAIRLANGDWFPYTRAIIEEGLGSRRIDVMLYDDNADKKLAVEILYTHAMGQQKIAFLQQVCCQALEIDVSGYPLDIQPDILANLLINETDDKEDFPLVYTHTPGIAPDTERTQYSFNWRQVFGAILVSFIIFAILGWMFSSEKDR